MRINKLRFLFLSFFYFFLFRDFLEGQIGILKYVDEVVALSAFPLFVFQLKNNGFKIKLGQSQVGYGRYIFLLSMIGLAGSLYFQYQPWAPVLSDFFLVIKFWLSIYVGKNFINGFLCPSNADIIFFHIKLMTWFYAVLILLDYISGGVFRAEIRYGLRSIQLFYSHPTVFCGCCVLLIVILLSIRDWVNGSERYFAALLLMTCSTLRSKAIGIAFAIAFIYYIVHIRKKKISLKTAVLLVPAVILIGWEQIEFYFFSSIQSGSARYQLLAKSILIANDCFPLGAGFASFGSYYSSVYYSPLYAMYGISNVYGLSQEMSAFISDSFWPMILGQFGWLGVACYGAALFALFICVQRVRTYSKAFYTSGLSALVYLLITSMAESAFVHPLAIPFAVWFGMLLQAAKPKR